VSPSVAESVAVSGSVVPPAESVVVDASVVLLVVEASVVDVDVELVVLDLVVESSPVDVESCVPPEGSSSSPQAGRVTQQPSTASVDRRGCFMGLAG
jgi:hypothetical protein